MVNFTFSGVGTNESAYWYGGFPQDSTGRLSVSLTDDVMVPITNNATNQTFTFTKRAGASVSYLDFTEVR